MLDSLRQPVETGEAIVARAIADLVGVERVKRAHIAEALSFRRLSHLR